MTVESVTHCTFKENERAASRMEMYTLGKEKACSPNTVEAFILKFILKFKSLKVGKMK